MTLRQPFTSLCRTLAGRRATDRVDLHIHSTFSDGTYAPAQIVDLARRSGLPALAITDHDTTDGWMPACQAAGEALEVVPGVEVTARYQDREFHLLGYFFRPNDEALQAALKEIRTARLERFWEMVARLGKAGVVLAEKDLEQARGAELLGRRHLAELLVKARRAASIQDAFRRYLGDDGRVSIPSVGLPVAEAISLVRGAGGVAAWAHPPYDCKREQLTELGTLGLQAVEVEYPAVRRRRVRELRIWAAELGLAVTGGSDCHGPGDRSVGACGITRAELESIRQLASG
jgi:predicted metal-dependent phosphoesterase TrpH